MGIYRCASLIAAALTAVVAIGTPATAAVSDPPVGFITDGFEFPSREEALKHLPELRQKVLENAGKPKRQSEKRVETPADAIRDAKEATATYAVPAASLPVAPLAVGDEDWITLDECEDKYDDGYTGDYWYKNKFSQCHSATWTFPILEVPTARPIADVTFDITYISRGYNGQRFLDMQIEIDDWHISVRNAEQWARIAPGLVYRFVPNCTALDPGSSCGDMGPTYVQVPVGQNAVEEMFFSPTTTTPWSGDTNLQDNKGYYKFYPDLVATHLAGLLTSSTVDLPEDNFRCDNASYGNTLGSGGCVFTNVVSYVQFSCRPDQGMQESTCFIADAFEDITTTYPGLIGTYVPGERLGSHGQLTRNYWQNNAIDNESRTAARALCRAGYGPNYTARSDGFTNDCDEYPFLKTYQNSNAPVGGSARRVAVRPVLAAHNQAVGRKLGAYYSADRVLDGDGYFVDIVDRGYCDGGQGGGFPAPIPIDNPPTVDAGPNRTGDEGTPINLSGVAYDDISTPTVTWSYSAGPDVDPGTTCVIGNTHALRTTITCNDNGTFTATLTASDGENDPVSDSATVTVVNAPPVITSLVPASWEVFRAGVGVPLKAAFTDAPNDTHTCAITWDDGSTSAIAAQSHACEQSHVFAHAGMYTIEVSVTDDDGATATAKTMVVVYDPDGGFATAGAQFTSPVGALSSDPLVAGRMKLQMNPKYKPHEPGPVLTGGKVSATLDGGAFSLDATRLDWLVVTPDAKMAVKGVGTVNGVAGYGFIVYGYDDPAKVRIVTWPLSSGANPGTANLYDNRRGGDYDLDRADPQDLDGGSLQVHV